MKPGTRRTRPERDVIEVDDCALGVAGEVLAEHVEIWDGKTVRVIDEFRLDSISLIGKGCDQ